MMEWSHSVEGIENVRQNIHNQSREWMKEVYGEIVGVKDSGKKHNEEYLAEVIFSFASEHRTCDNGGFNACCCPNNCRAHMISFGEK